MLILHFKKLHLISKLFLIFDLMVPCLREVRSNSVLGASEEEEEEGGAGGSKQVFVLFFFRHGQVESSEIRRRLAEIPLILLRKQKDPIRRPFNFLTLTIR